MFRECTENCKITWHKVIKFQRPRFPLTSLQESKVGSKKKAQRKNKWELMLSAMYFRPLLSCFTSFCDWPPCSSLTAILDRHNAPSCSLRPDIRSILNGYISPFHFRFFASPVSKQRLPSLTMESWYTLMYKEKVRGPADYFKRVENGLVKDTLLSLSGWPSKRTWTSPGQIPKILALCFCR